MKSIEVKGKTIEEALKAGLNELGGVKLDDVDVKVLKHPGIFSKAVVQMTLTAEVAENLDTTTPLALMSKIQKRAKEAEPYIAQNAKHFQKNAARPQQNAAVPAKPEQKPAAIQTARPEQKFTAVQTAKPEQKPVTVQPARPEQKFVKPFAPQTKPEQPAAARERNFVKPTDEELSAAKTAAEKYLSTSLRLMDIDASLVSAASGDEVNIDIKTESQQVIGYRGETLDALEYLTMLSVSGDNRIKVNLDSGGYREKRTASLVELAKRLADKAVRTGRKVDLEPMSSLNRKVIHAALSENDAVFTKSEGHEPNRYLVIIPKKSGGHQNKNGNHNNNRNNRNNNNRGNGKQAE